jgi:hypothetical protein
MALILLGIYSYFLGLTIFIIYEIARDRITSTMLKIALVLFAVEWTGLSTLYY